MIDELERGDHIRIRSESLSDTTYRVRDVAREDLGLTEILVVGLFRDADDSHHLIEWATHSDTAVLKEVDSNDEYEITTDDIEKE